MDAGEVDPTWLSRVLGRPVAGVDVTATDAFNSRTSRLVVHDADGRSHPPDRLVLKRNGAADWAVAAGLEEVAFYTTVRDLDPPPPAVVPPRAAGTHGRDSYLLLPDLSDTHAPPLTRAQQVALVGSVPSPELLDACVTTLARHHAYWWDHPLLGSGRFDVGYWSRDEARVEAYVVRRKDALGALPRDQVPRATLDLCRAILEDSTRHARERLVPRFAAGRHLTLGHGDAYFANFLCPRGRNGPTYLIDWQSPEVDHCGNDLANLLATFWTAAQRHEDERETACLRLYHRTLREHGVAGYTWEDLLDDYRSGLRYWLLVPVQDAADGSSPSYWRPKLACLASAVRDWVD